MKSILKYVFLTLASLLLVACNKGLNPQVPESEKEYDQVVIICCAAFNNLSSDINNNINTVCKSVLPMKSSNKAIVVFTHNSRSDSDYQTMRKPCIFRIYADWSGSAIKDTLITYPDTSFMTDKKFFSTGLKFISDNFKSKSYGMIYSSHGTGWLPEGYYEKPTTSGSKRLAKLEGPKVKSIGCEARGTSESPISYESNIMDFADALPMHLNYLIFDACLMGGIEIAYELKDKADHIAFSQAEILSTGMDYSNLTNRLLAQESPDVKGFCEDYYTAYSKESGQRQSATISLIRTAELEKFATVCKDIFESNRSSILTVKADNIQRYFRKERHWFYDLEDILIKSKVPETDMQNFRNALEKCIEYKAATPRILSEIEVTCYSGFSSYLPSNGNSYLNNYYKGLSWNKATDFVK